MDQKNDIHDDVYRYDHCGSYITDHNGICFDLAKEENST
tara:strand:+ start:303 stop:419 length:117 start_codon:yes stop_codon:yes gene_type:complete